MTRETRRQVSLLGVLGVLVVVYLRFGSGGAKEAMAGPADVPPIDVFAVMSAIRDIATIDPRLVLEGGERPDSEADRNLFQYGQRRPSAAEMEAQRKAAEAALIAQENALREQKRLEEEQRKQAETLAEQQRQEAERLAQQQQQQQEEQAKLPPAPPPKPVAPAVNFKLMGMLGSSERKLGVFLEGDKVMMARQGEVLLGQFKVLSIGPEYAVIGFVDPIHKDETRKLHLGR